MPSPAPLLQMGEAKDLRRDGTCPMSRIQVRLRTGLELKHPASKQAVLMNRQERPSSSAQEAGRTHEVPAGPSVPKPTCPKLTALCPS